MEEVAKRSDIILKNADKGDTVVINDLDKFISEAIGQLCDKHHYKALQEDPTLQHSKLVNDTSETFKKENFVSKKWPTDIKPSVQKRPKSYILPNMHKENNSIRLTVISIVLLRRTHIFLTIISNLSCEGSSIVH